MLAYAVNKTLEQALNPEPQTMNSEPYKLQNNIPRMLLYLGC